MAPDARRVVGYLLDKAWRFRVVLLAVEIGAGYIRARTALFRYIYAIINALSCCAVLQYSAFARELREKVISGP